MDTLEELKANINTLESSLKNNKCFQSAQRLNKLKEAIEREYCIIGVKVNGYKIRYNSQFKAFQVSHNEIGTCEEFKTLKEAEEYSLKG